MTVILLKKRIKMDCSLQKHITRRSYNRRLEHEIMSSFTHPHLVPTLYDFYGTQKEKFSRIFFHAIKGN